MPKRTDDHSIALISQYASIGGLLRHYLASHARMEVLWEANTGEDGLRQCARKSPSLAIVSPNYPDMSGGQLARTLRERHPELRVLLFAGIMHPELVREMMDARIHGIVAARSPLPSLLTGVRVVLDGGCYFDGVAESMLHAPPPGVAPLSTRERLVLRLIAEGFSTKEIAGEIAVSVKTAEKYRERIMAKLDLHDAVKLTRYALRHGISALH